MLSTDQDAYGHAIQDYFRMKAGYEVCERDDGFILINDGPLWYFREYPDWLPIEQESIEFARGRVLDVGCGAGRCGLHLQKKKMDVVGIDISPLAVAVCKLRGIQDTRVLSISQISPTLGVFDTMVMFGHNFGLAGSVERTRALFKRFARISHPGTLIIADSVDPHLFNEPCHRLYYEANVKRNRMPGQMRLRVRYRTYATPWFDNLLVSQREMKEVLEGTGWHVDRFIGDSVGHYMAIIARG